ncbi:hypothetical protein [Paraglaciecola sp.]|uniref:hypothetical protein n=1 Tax=Paraglaciecola sp. TaxID=1920173 RepID=UPI0030F3C73B
MRQQFSWFFAVFFIALFSTFSLVAHAHPQDLSEIEHTPTEQHASSLVNNNSVVEPLALLKTSLTCAVAANHAKNICKYHVESIWFNTLFRSLAVLAIHYQYNLDSLYKHQQNVVANISEMSWLILAITLPLCVDTSTQLHSL